MSIHLDPCLEAISQGAILQNPIVQVIEIQKDQIYNEGNVQSKTITINDGKFYITVLLDAYVSLFWGEKLNLFQLIKIRYKLIKKVIVIKEIQPIDIKINGIIGNPIKIEVEYSSSQDSQILLSSQSDFTISQLIPNKENFSIVARVVSKSPIRPFSKGNGQFFFITLRDNETEIEGKFFKDNRNNSSNQIDLNAYYDQIHLNHVYEIKNGHVQFVYSNQKSQSINDLEIVFHKNTVFTEVEDDGSIAPIPVNFIKINSIKEISVDSQVDLRAIIVDEGGVHNYHYKNREIKNRKVLLADDSNATINFVLWDDKVDRIDPSQVDHVIEIRKASVNNYQGKKEIVCNDFTEFYILENMDNSSLILLNWWTLNKPYVGNLNHLSKDVPITITLGEIRSRNLGMNPELPDTFICYVEIEALYQFGYYLFFNGFSFETSSQSTGPGAILYFNACPNCKSKMVEKDENLFFCNKCKTTTAEPKIMYKFDAGLKDDTADTVFRVNQYHQEIGETILGVTASEWKEKTEDLTKEERVNVIKNRVEGRKFKIEGMASSKNLELVTLSIEKIEEIFDDDDDNEN